MLTVRNLLERFPDFSLLTNTELGKEVSSVSVMDAPDIERWMKGGEFLITSGFTLVSRIEEFGKLIRDLDARKIAALGIKVSRFMHAIPADILELANSLNFNIIEIPEHYAFTDIINPVLAEIVNSRYRELTVNEEMNRKFLEIGIADISYEKILNLLSRYLGDQVFYLNARNQEIHKTQFCDKPPSIRELKSDAYSNYDIEYQRVHYGTLFVKGNASSFQERMAITHAITMLRLSIQSILSSKRYEEQRRNDFLSDLILNNIHSKEEIDFRSQEYGWKLDDGVFCAVFNVDPKKPDTRVNLSRKLPHQLESIRLALKERCKDCYYVRFSNYIVFLLVGMKQQAQKKAFVDMLPALIEEFGSQEFSITIGVGNTYPDINHSCNSYNEAKQAVSIGQALFGTDQFYLFDSISIYDLYTRMSDEELERFVYLDAVEMLDQTDRETGTDHIRTLAALIDTDWKMSEAAEQLTVHYNTMKNRTAKIKELTTWQFETREEKFNIEIAFKIFLLTRKSKVHLTKKRVSNSDM